MKDAGSDHDMHIYVHNRLNALTYPLRACCKQCVGEAKAIRFELSDGDYRLAMEWLDAAEDYSQFCSIFPMWHRSRLNIAVEGSAWSFTTRLTRKSRLKPTTG
jgi:hypothetical protein